MNLKNLSDQDLLDQIQKAVHRERECLTQVLHHLREVERRKLYADLGHPSLFMYAVKALGYGEGEAGRRLQALRMLREIPEVEERLAEGRLSLSTVSRAQSFFRETNTSQLQEKREVLKKLENQSTREAEK